MNLEEVMVILVRIILMWFGKGQNSIKLTDPSSLNVQIEA